MLEARSASSRMTVSGSRMLGGMWGTSVRKSANPSTEASGLLRSWAMPAISWPMADIFSDWISWSCNRRRSVWSSNRRTTALRSVLLIGTAVTA